MNSPEDKRNSSSKTGSGSLSFISSPDVSQPNELPANRSTSVRQAKQTEVPDGSAILHLRRLLALLEEAASASDARSGDLEKEVRQLVASLQNLYPVTLLLPPWAFALSLEFSKTVPSKVVIGIFVAVSPRLRKTPVPASSHLAPHSPPRACRLLSARLIAQPFWQRWPSASDSKWWWRRT